jgi:hypothetical protein
MTKIKEKDWTKKMPTKVGLYKIICAETGDEISYVTITKNDKGILMVHDDGIGRYDLESYHNNLTNLFWLSVA